MGLYRTKLQGIRGLIQVRIQSPLLTTLITVLSKAMTTSFPNLPTRGIHTSNEGVWLLLHYQLFILGLCLVVMFLISNLEIIGIRFKACKLLCPHVAPQRFVKHPIISTILRLINHISFLVGRANITTLGNCT